MRGINNKIQHNTNSTVSKEVTSYESFLLDKDDALNPNIGLGEEIIRLPNGTKYYKSYHFMEDSIRVTQDVWKLAAALSPAALKIMDYITKFITDHRHNVLNIELKYSDVADKVKLSKSGFSEALKELVEHKIIKPLADSGQQIEVKRNVYKINTNVLFYGDVDWLNDQYEAAIRRKENNIEEPEYIYI